MCDDRGEDEDTETGERNDEHVKVSVVSLSNTVSNPGTVMIKSFCFQKDIKMKEICQNIVAEFSR